MLGHSLKSGVDLKDVQLLNIPSKYAVVPGLLPLNPIVVRLFDIILFTYSKFVQPLNVDFI